MGQQSAAIQHISRRKTTQNAFVFALFFLNSPLIKLNEGAIYVSFYRTGS